MFAELSVEVQRQARRAYRTFRDNPKHPSLVLSPFIQHATSTLLGSALIIELWAF
jgi:hypothetical protein